MNHHRTGVSLIEIIVVISVISLLSMMTAPGIFRAMRQGTVNDAALAVKMLAEQAQSEAMRTGADIFFGDAPTAATWGDGLDRCHGVRVTPAANGKPATVVRLRGNQAIGVPQPISESVDLRRWAVAQPAIINDTTDLVLCDTPIEWWYTWRTGRPSADPAGLTPLNQSISFTVATRDYAVATANGKIDQKGIANQVTVYRSTGVVRAQ